MKKIILIIALFAILPAFAMDKEIIDVSKVVSSGSIVLVKHEGFLKILLGQRNKPGKDEHGTWASFHGNIIKGREINDLDALEAAKRNLVWEMMKLEGDPKKFPIAEKGSEIYNRQLRAYEFINKLSPYSFLKNNDWENKQRPNFVFVVDYEDIKEIMDNFADNEKYKKWPSEISTLQLFDILEIIKAISVGKAKHNGEVPYGQFIQYADHQLYDAFARTIAVSFDEFTQIVLKLEK